LFPSFTKALFVVRQTIFDVIKLHFLLKTILNRKRFSLIVLICVMALSCRNKNTGDGVNEDTLFTLLPASQTNVHFSNTLTEGLNTNVLMYEYFYNGGGVSIGDVNNDGLQDIYFSGNMVDNKLYLNRGKMKFEDITDSANVQGRPGPWKTGITMADINGDNKLDLFVCYSGKINGKKRIPQLFINQGNDNNNTPRFKDEAKEYGITDAAFSTQAYFFDYDRDGDLDMLLINHNPKRLSNLTDASINAYIAQQDKQTGTRLFKNDHNHFEDVTTQSGIVSSPLSYNLAAGIADINKDGWPDIYISNDYLVPDYLYINNNDGTFSDQLQKKLSHTSQFSMGNNIADINNDCLPDIFTLDMLPEDNHRQKMLYAPDNYELFDLNVRTGFYYQYMRNMLHLNNGDGSFSEIGQLSGISNTDWSWSPLFADYDNDGWKDLFVTNGYLRDYTNMDFLAYIGDQLKKTQDGIYRQELLDILQKMPSSNIMSYFFKNNGNLTFSNVSGKWGINSFSNSNGAAYADLDNDGDLDIIVNNINKPAFIYRNESSVKASHYLEIKLEGAGNNTQGIGAKLYTYAGGKEQYQEQMTAIGYQSSVTPVLHFGLGKDNIVDSLRIVWQSGKLQLLKNIKVNQFITLNEKDAALPYTTAHTPPLLFEEVKPSVAYRHASTNINDFKRQPLLVNPLSFSGPCMIKGDVNGDKLEDIYAGGGNGNAGALYIQQANGSFIRKYQRAFDQDKAREDADGLFFDANGDKYDDLYVVSGGYNNYSAEDTLLQDRLYMNDGNGNFTKSDSALPLMHVSKSCVRAADINADGFPDLFVGGRVIPGRYPEKPQSFILINDGKGRFTNQTIAIAPEIQKTGMITDATWIDLNNDKVKDLIVVGEWMPVSVYINSNGKLINKTKDYFDKEYSGWWNKLLAEDMNDDGMPDLVIGNLGLNAQCKASDEEPAEMYYKDFDGNGFTEPILCLYIQGESYPYLSRDELVSQINGMAKKFKYYKDYADATLQNVFTAQQLKDAVHLKANNLATTYFQRGSDGKFHKKDMPLQAQFAPVFTITAIDYNKDGNKDLLLCGNINHARLRFGNYDGNHGVLLKGDGKGNFAYISQQQSGFYLRGDVRSVVEMNNLLLFGINQGELKAYKLRKDK
jgi:hypothetical protein